MTADATRQPPRPGGPPAPGALGAVLLALGFGLLTGWLELGLVLAQRRPGGAVSMASLRTNRHFLWMIPAADLALFAAAGLVAAAAGRRRAAVAWRLYPGLAALTLLLDVEGLHGAACLALAAGVGVRLGPPLGRLAARHRRAAAGGAAVLAAALVALVPTAYLAVRTAERRALSALPPPRPGAPNVLLIVMDNVRASSMSLYGHGRPTTPNVQALARRGVLFTEARSTSSWTLPSHASLFTGRWGHELSCDFDRPLDATHPTLAEALSGDGYAAAGFVGNTFYGNARYGLGRGFARYEDDYENRAVTPFEALRSSGLGRRLLHALGFPTRVGEGASVRKTAAMLNADVLGWLDRRPAGRPFFVFLNYFDAHAPFLPPDGPDPRFGLAGLPAAEKARLILRESRLAGGPPVGTDAEADRVRRDANSVRLDSYESCIAYLDRQVGRLVEGLDRRGLGRDTLVVLTSDHGEHFAERGFYGHGLSLYRPEVHVPLLIVPPLGGPAGLVVRRPVSLCDTAATVVDLVGRPGPGPFPGRSLARFWRPGAAPAGPEPPLLSEVGRRKDIPR